MRFRTEQHTRSGRFDDYARTLLIPEFEVRNDGRRISLTSSIQHLYKRVNQNFRFQPLAEIIKCLVSNFRSCKVINFTTLGSVLASEKKHQQSFQNGTEVKNMGKKSRLPVTAYVDNFLERVSVKI